MGTYIEPLNLRKIFLEYLLGSTELFLLAFIIALSVISAKFQIPNMVFLILLVICSLIMGAILGQGIFILILIIVGYITFKMIGRLVIT